MYRKILGEICNISGVAFLSLCLLPVGCGACDRREILSDRASRKKIDLLKEREEREKKEKRRKRKRKLHYEFSWGRGTDGICVIGNCREL